jgi:hypothetical protein
MLSGPLQNLFSFPFSFERNVEMTISRNWLIGIGIVLLVAVVGIFLSSADGFFVYKYWLI